MDITYTLSLDDYKDVIKRFSRKSTAVKLKRVFNRAFPSVVAFVVPLTNATPSITDALLYAIVTSIVWIPLYTLIMKRRVGKIYRQSHLHLSRSVSLGENGLHILTPLTESTVSWNAVTRIDNDSKFVYFMTTKSAGIFIPKSGFSGPSQAAEFLLRAQSYWYQQNKEVQG